MPIYTYKCNKCGETFDKLVKPGNGEAVQCRYCKSETRRVFSPVGIIFKGSGFYSTDYKSGNNKATAGKSQSEKDVEKKPKGDAGQKEKAQKKAKSGEQGTA